MDNVNQPASDLFFKHPGEFVRYIPFPFAVLDRGLSFLMMSDEWISVHHPKSADILGRTFSEVLPHIHTHLRDTFLRALEGNSLEVEVCELFCEDGTGDFLEWIVRPWKVGGGAVSGLLICTSSTNQRASNRKKVQEQNTFIKALFAKSQIGLNLCRMDGLWLESNSAFLEIIGYTREEADGGLTYWDLTPEKYLVAEELQLNSLSETGRYGPYEKEFIRKDGRLVPVRLNGFLINREGEEFIWSFIEDITEWKRLEENLENERVKSIHSAKLATLGEIAAGIAHEVNNPLAIIDGYLSKLALLSERGELDQKELLTGIDKMKSATERASRIVLGLRTFAREGSSDGNEETTFQRIIDDTLILCQTRLQNRDIELQIENRSQATIVVNPLELSQVLLNLINNATDALEECKEIQAKQIVIASSDDLQSNSVVVEVIDSGPGIPADLVANIFDPFFTTKEIGKGTGLGLSISRGIIERHHGELNYSRQGARSCFSFRIPAKGLPHV